MMEGRENGGGTRLFSKEMGEMKNTNGRD